MHVSPNRMILVCLVSVFFFLHLSLVSCQIESQPPTQLRSPQRLDKEYQSAIKCNKTAMDETFRWLFFFTDPSRQLPSTTELANEFCDEKSRKELYLREYATRCLAQFPRQLMSLLMFGVVRKNRYYCAYTKGRSEFIQFATCLNKIKSKGAHCMNDMIRDFMAIKHSPIKARIGKTCCTYYRFEECLVQKASEDHTVCQSRDVGLLEELFEGYTGQMLQHVCARYPRDVDHCSKLLSRKEMSRLRKKVSEKEFKQTFSLLPPMIDILDSIPP